jgi:type I restriction enzyme S subunit
LCIRRAKPKLEAQAPQSAQKNINLDDLRPLLIPVPGPKEQKQIADLYDAADRLVLSEEGRQAKLQRLKRGLMQDLLTGRVRVNRKTGEHAAACRRGMTDARTNR